MIAIVSLILFCMSGLMMTWIMSATTESANNISSTKSTVGHWFEMVVKPFINSCTIYATNEAPKIPTIILMSMSLCLERIMDN
jgi:hypothetical protein